MESLEQAGKEYFNELQKRAKKSRVYRDYQLAGLELANILKDWGHKALYIKLAKTYNPEKLIQLAKSIAEKKNIDNMGAYFMKVLKDLKNENINNQK